MYRWCFLDGDSVAYGDSTLGGDLKYKVYIYMELDLIIYPQLSFIEMSLIMALIG